MVELATDWSKVAEPTTEQDQRYALDSRLHVRFYVRPLLMHALSEQAQRPIYQDHEFVQIIVPGDKYSILDRLASDDDKRRFHEHYGRFKAGKGDEVVGTRLEAVTWMSRSKVEEYRFFNIHTVEQLASANDSVGQRFQGFHNDREKARRFLEASEGTDARVKALEQQLAEMKTLLESRKESETVLKPIPVKK